MDLAGHFRAQTLTLKDKLQGQMSVGYRAHISINHKEIQLCIQGKKQPLCFQNEAQNIPRQAFIMMNLSCKSENSTYYTLGSRG